MTAIAHVVGSDRPAAFDRVLLAASDRLRAIAVRRMERRAGQRVREAFTLAMVESQRDRGAAVRTGMLPR